MKQDVSEEMLIRYLLKEAVAEEEKAVKDWVQESEANARELEGMKMIFESGKQLAPVSPLKADAAWDKFKELRSAAQQNDKKLRSLYPAANWFRVAAAVTIFVGIGCLLFNILKNKADNPGNMVSIRTLKNVKVVTLPDGSIIHINKNSSITYASNFNSRRVITLSGEAFFKVKHNEDAPFTVITNDLTIKDVGTAFNVNGKNHRTEVIVESGIVQIGHSSASVRLNANEMVTIKAGERNMTVQRSTDILYNYYRTNQFVAFNTPLHRLVDVLNEAYDQKIIISNKLVINEPITVTINRDDSLARILNVIKGTTPALNIVKNGNGYSIQ
ncbi:FecR family protein [Mucilaginibacter polytrichastri]|uniref:Uncharacterized protein n=1 Tax=Mucilaginibacter polytrichastri TaxID=1302689 RepID=A0A1Q6A3Q7_9SPHI|nr:FecR family protein [Mucilaginibacter polytrichastri]OKS88632.1 hypothetical protein RG47T_4104 [Mucilaginibacter polytrichastri]SFT26365.1 FecR family protein [Mucilaginibacter polytrichastri]